MVAPNPDRFDEFMFGRVGYLYSLLLVNRHVSPNTIDSSVLRQVYHQSVLLITVVCVDNKSGFVII